MQTGLRVLTATAMLAAVMWTIATVPVAGQAPAAAPGVAATPAGWTPPRTPWGDPDLQGSYTNNDENGIPLERPDEFESRRLDDITPEELERLRQEREERRVEVAPRLGVLPGSNPVHWFEHFGAANSRAWLIVDPPDGKVPPLTEEARNRPGGRGAAASATARSTRRRISASTIAASRVGSRAR